MDWNDFTLTKSGAEWVLNSLMQTFLLSILGVLFYCAFKSSSTRLKSRLLTSIVIAMLACPVIALPYNFWKKSTLREVSRAPRYFVEKINNRSNSGASLSPETSTPNRADTERVYVKDLSDPIDTQSREISSLKEPLLIPESFIRIVATIWFSGILLCGFMLTLSWFRLRRWTSCLKPVQDPRLLKAWKSITGRSTEQHPILTLPLNHPVFSPYVFGLTKPKLVPPRPISGQQCNKLISKGRRIRISIEEVRLP